MRVISDYRPATSKHFIFNTAGVVVGIESLHEIAHVEDVVGHLFLAVPLLLSRVARVGSIANKILEYSVSRFCLIKRITLLLSGCF
jgi:hypothetical protein